MALVASIAAGTLFAALALAACGGSGEATTAATDPGDGRPPNAEGPAPPTGFAPGVEPPPPGIEGLPPTGPVFAAGRDAVADTGCLACHRIGTAGNGGRRALGPELTTIGAELDRAELRRAIVSGPSFMPSYRELPRAELAAMVGYLGSLR